LKEQNELLNQKIMQIKSGAKNNGTSSEPKPKQQKTENKQENKQEPKLPKQPKDQSKEHEGPEIFAVYRNEIAKRISTILNISLESSLTVNTFLFVRMLIYFILFYLSIYFHNS
jgi:hypothetical protein